MRAGPQFAMPSRSRRRWSGSQVASRWGPTWASEAAVGSSRKRCPARPWRQWAKGISLTQTAPTPEALGPLAWLGTALVLIGVAFEGTADFQLARFKAVASNAGKVLDTGLWRYSRHPNYFGEIVIWIGIAIIALPSLQGWSFITLISPVFVAVLITQISGVPLLEKFADKKWGGQKAYEEYKRSTPVLIPKLPFM